MSHSFEWLHTIRHYRKPPQCPITAVNFDSPQNGDQAHVNLYFLVCGPIQSEAKAISTRRLPLLRPVPRLYLVCLSSHLSCEDLQRGA